MMAWEFTDLYPDTQRTIVLGFFGLFALVLYGGYRLFKELIR